MRKLLTALLIVSGLLGVAAAVLQAMAERRWAEANANAPLWRGK